MARPVSEMTEFPSRRSSAGDFCFRVSITRQRERQDPPGSKAAPRLRRLCLLTDAINKVRQWGLTSPFPLCFVLDRVTYFLFKYMESSWCGSD